MQFWRSLLPLVVALGWPSVSWSILVVDPPRPITHQVNVRLIETALSDGSSTAMLFGDPSQRSHIESGVDAIWAQAGIDVNFLPNAVRYYDTFALQGSIAPGEVRPSGDLNRVIREANSRGGILHPDDSVINLFMVDVVPGFSARGAGWAGGLANVGTNGVALSVGENLLANAGGRDALATLVAHEIGHNLGLHHSTDSANLMAQKRSSAQLSSEQIDAVFKWHFRNDSVAFIPQGGTGFVKPISTPLVGDYTGNGIVDAADYTVWRDTVGTSSQKLVTANHGLVVDSGDYEAWKSFFGRSILPQDLPGDYNDNGTVDAADYTVWRDTLGSHSTQAADANRNFVVEEDDRDTWKDSFGSALTPPQSHGDYNRDGAVNAADYTIWRDSLGSGTNLIADGNGNRIIDEGDYGIWRGNFRTGTGSGLSSTLAQSVPEPATFSALAMALAMITISRRAWPR